MYTNLYVNRNNKIDFALLVTFEFKILLYKKKFLK